MNMNVVQTHVHDVYEQIAHHFDETRTSQWAGVRAFLDALPMHSTVVDIGCGNGKYHIGFDNKLSFFGADTCASLISIAKEKQKNAATASYVLANGLDLPYRSGAFDAAISIAVLHHLPDAASRRCVIDEALRVVRPGGSLFITAWAGSSNTDKRKAGKWREMGTKGDHLVPWHDKHTQRTHYRYYHLFEKDELCELFKHVFEHKQASSVHVGFELDNWNVTVRKN
jgi:ubiquinone/menaquinone biosynthesis C-methylase UbiE